MIALLLLLAFCARSSWSQAAPSSCLDILSSVSQPASGIFQITTRTTNTTLSVYCDFDRFEGGWLRVFRHNLPATSLFDFGQLDANREEPTSLKYSIISYLSEFKEASGPFEFLMEWPGSSFPLPQVWRQFDISSTAPASYVPISVPYSTRGFAGFRQSQAWQAIYTASSTTWAYAVAQSGTYGGALYGPDGPVPEVALWVREMACHSSCTTCKGSAESDCLSCPTGFTLAKNLGTCIRSEGLVLASFRSFFHA
jgi:hypothetical protein